MSVDEQRQETELERPLDRMLNDFDQRMETKKRVQRETLQPVPEREDAPRARSLERDREMVTKPVTWFEDYDREMAVAPVHNPKLAAALERQKERVLDKSPQQNVEAMLLEFEKNYRMRKQFRWKGQERWQGAANEAMRVVNLMTPAKFIVKLQAAGVHASITPNVDARLSLNNYTKLGLIGVGAKIDRKLQTATVLQYPIGPEFSVMRFDQYNVPTKEKFRGWRTALLCLILKGVVTKSEAVRAFGPCEGQAGEFYREQLKAYRERVQTP